MKLFGYMQFPYGAALFDLSPEETTSFNRNIKFSADVLGGSNLTILTKEIIELDSIVMRLTDYNGNRIFPGSDLDDAAYRVNSQSPILNPSGVVEVWTYTLVRI